LRKFAPKFQSIHAKIAPQSLIIDPFYAFFGRKYGISTVENGDLAAERYFSHKIERIVLYGIIHRQKTPLGDTKKAVFTRFRVKTSLFDCLKIIMICVLVNK